MSAATATPWGNRGKLSDRIVGPDEKTIAEFVSQALGKNGDEQDEANAVFCTFIVNNTQTILAAIEALKLRETVDETFLRLKGVKPPALKPMADMVMVPRDLLKQVVTFDRGYDCGCINISRQMETAYETGQCPHQKLRAMLAAAPPASPAPSDEGRVERIAKAFERVLLDIDFAIEQGILPDIMNDMIYVEARAALAAIGER